MKQDIEWNETHKCKCRLDASTYNSKQTFGIKINADVNVKNLNVNWNRLIWWRIYLESQ